MGYFRDLLILAEAVFIPELATYETEIFAGACIVFVVLSLGTSLVRHSFNIVPGHYEFNLTVFKYKQCVCAFTNSPTCYQLLQKRWKNQIAQYKLCPTLTPPPFEFAILYLFGILLILVAEK